MNHTVNLLRTEIMLRVTYFDCQNEIYFISTKESVRDSLLCRVYTNPIFH